MTKRSARVGPFVIATQTRGAIYFARALRGIEAGIYELGDRASATLFDAHADAAKVAALLGSGCQVVPARARLVRYRSADTTASKLQNGVTNHER